MTSMYRQVLRLRERTTGDEDDRLTLTAVINLLAIHGRDERRFAPSCVKPRVDWLVEASARTVRASERTSEADSWATSAALVARLASRSHIR
jgi:hypothetical protein